MTIYNSALDSDGTVLGQTAAELIAFHGSTAVNQAAATEDLGVLLSDKGLRAAGTAYPITTSGAVALTGTLSVTDITVTNDLTMGDAGNMILDTTTGTQIGTATGQKIGFHGATPVVQSVAGTDLGTVLSDNGLRAAGTAYPITTTAAVATGAITATGAISATTTITSTGPTSGVGYATGAGGAVTQASTITTAVVLNTMSGAITTVSATLATTVDATFTLTNSNIAATDYVGVSIQSYGGTADGIPVVNTTATAAGSCTINIMNNGATTLDAVIVINFVVIKAVSA